MTHNLLKFQFFSILFKRTNTKYNAYSQCTYSDPKTLVPSRYFPGGSTPCNQHDVPMPMFSNKWRKSLQLWSFELIVHCWKWNPIGACIPNCIQNVLKNRRNALSKCKLVKFRKVSDTVWICFEAVITEKTIKEEWTDKNNSDDNYNLVI